MLKVDICSDLHVDAWHHETVIHDPTRRRWTGEPFASTWVYVDWHAMKNPDSRVLIIAGDVSNNIITTRDVLEVAADAYEYVVFVDGNHDHYGNRLSVDDGMAALQASLTQWPNIYYLKHDTGLLLDGVAFLGATGWYDFRAYVDQGIGEDLAKRTWLRYSNDSRLPTYDDQGPEGLAVRQAKALADQVALASGDDAIESIVVTTHMSPRADLMEWKAADPTWNALTPSYVNTQLADVLTADDHDKISHWIYGHTHRRRVDDINGVRYINNARGYPRENQPFSLTQIEVPTK